MCFGRTSATGNLCPQRQVNEKTKDPAKPLPRLPLPNALPNSPAVRTPERKTKDEETAKLTAQPSSHTMKSPTPEALCLTWASASRWSHVPARKKAPCCCSGTQRLAGVAPAESLAPPPPPNYYYDATANAMTAPTHIQHHHHRYRYADYCSSHYVTE